MCMGWGGYGLLSAVAPSLRGQVLLSFDGLSLLLACPRGSDHGVAPFAPPFSDLGWVCGWPSGWLRYIFLVRLGLGWDGLDGVARSGTFGDSGGPLCGPGFVLVAPPRYTVLGDGAVVW